MADDKTKTAEDRKLISLTEDYEVRYWTHELGVAKDELTDLIKKHGNAASAVRRALGR